MTKKEGAGMDFEFYITPEEYKEASLYGVDPNVLEQRIRSLGWGKERALKTPTNKKKSLKEWVDTASKNGICYSTLRYRVNQLGWDHERAATQPLQDRKEQAKKAYLASRKYPKEILALAERNGISADMFRRRVRSGWDTYEAATTPKMTPSEIGLMTKAKRDRF